MAVSLGGLMILSHVVLSVLSCLVLSHVVLSCPTLSRHVPMSLLRRYLLAVTTPSSPSILPPAMLAVLSSLASREVQVRWM